MFTSAQFNWSAANSKNGLDVGGSYSHQVGNPNNNLQGTVFGQGNLRNGNSLTLTDKTYGASATYNK